MAVEWIGRIDFDPATAAKIRVKHHLTESDIRDAVGYGRAERGEFKRNTPYGPRLTVYGMTDAGHRIKVLLAPVDRRDGVWECKTAFRV